MSDSSEMGLQDPHRIVFFGYAAVAFAGTVHVYQGALHSSEFVIVLAIFLGLYIPLVRMVGE